MESNEKRNNLYVIYLFINKFKFNTVLFMYILVTWILVY